MDKKLFDLDLQSYIKLSDKPPSNKYPAEPPSSPQTLTRYREYHREYVYIKYSCKTPP